MLKDGYIFHFFYDIFCFVNFRKMIGSSLTDGLDLLYTGAAPINPETKEFLACALARPFLEGYAHTETVANGTNTKIWDFDSFEHVGGLVPSMEMKLIDCPDCGAFVDHKDDNGN